MIELKEINNFNIKQEEKYEIILDINSLIEINKNVNENLFINNQVDYITFNIYKDRTFMTINSLTKEKEPINNIKKFDCINKELLFKECSELNKNNIQEYIKKRDYLSRIYVTLTYPMFKYIVENICNTFVIQLKNEVITVTADDVVIPVEYYIYKKN